MPEVMHELQEIRTLAREFARAELRPHVEEWDRDRTLPESVLAQVAEVGFFGMTVPESHGGMGFDLPTYVAALEEIAWGEPAVALLVAQSAIAAAILQQHSSPAAKSRLETLARGESMVCLALAEERGGFDLRQAGTRATPKDKGWAIDGAKAWVTNARGAQLALVLARTGDDAFALFAVPYGAGVTAGEAVPTMGLRCLAISDLVLQNVRVDADAVLLGPAPMSRIVAAWSELGHLSIAAMSLGLSQAALEHALAYADQREQFGRKLREFEGIQYKLADMATRTEAARALVARAAAERQPRLGAMAKVFASETAMWVSTQAVQIFGGYGYMRDYPVEKIMRDAKAMELLEGANELIRVEIAEALYE